MVGKKYVLIMVIVLIGGAFLLYQIWLANLFSEEKFDFLFFPRKIKFSDNYEDCGRIMSGKADKRYVNIRPVDCTIEHLKDCEPAFFKAAYFINDSLTSIMNIVVEEKNEECVLHVHEERREGFMNREKKDFYCNALSGAGNVISLTKCYSIK